MKNKIVIRAALGFLLGSAALVLGDKPDPKPLDRRPTGPDIQAFKEAYQRAGEPRMLVLCGIDMGQAGEQPRAVTGSELPNRPPTRVVGRGLALFDRTGDSTLLKSTIEDVFTQDKSVELVHLDSLAEMDRREIDLLQLRDEGQAVRMLANKANADIVLLVRMLGGSAIGDRGARYRVTVELIQANRGRKIGGFGFDWREGVEAENVKEYGSAVARKAIDSFVSWYAKDTNGTAAPYNLRLIGLTDIAQYKKARDAFGKIQGIERVRDGSADFGRDTSVSSMTIRYNGRPLDLVYELQQTATKELGLTVQGTDGNSGSITLIAQRQVNEPHGVEMWRVLTSPKDPGFKAANDALLAAYDKASQPKIGIIVNRELADKDKKDPQVAQELQRLSKAENPAGTADAGAGSRGVYVAINLAQGGGLASSSAGGSAGADAPQPLKVGDTVAATKGEDSIDTRRTEDYLYKRFLGMNLRMVDPNAARAEVEKQMDKARRIYRDDELVFLLGRAAGVDVVIHGVGRIERKKKTEDTIEGNSLVYTFRAVRVSDGMTLAAEGFALDLSVSKSNEDAAVENVANWIAGHLAEQMMGFWTPPRNVRVTLYNAKTPRDVSTIMTFFEEKVPKISKATFESHEAGKEGGVGVFTIRCGDSYESLLKSIMGLSGKLPFDFDSSQNDPNNLTLKLRDGL